MVRGSPVVAVDEWVLPPDANEFALGQRLGADLPALDGVLACRGDALAILLSGEAEDAAVTAPSSG